MAEGNFYHNEQIIVLDPTEDYTRDRLILDGVILTGTAAGSFVIQIGIVPMTFTTGSPLLSIYIPLNRSANYIKLTSGPAGATAYFLLKRRV